MSARLCQALYPNKVFLHVDLKSDVCLFEDALAKVEASHVKLTKKRIEVNWAGFSQVQAMRILIDAAAMDAQNGEHFVMLSGQDYPIKSVAQFTEFLERNSNVQFIKCFEIDKSLPNYYNHISRRHHRDLNLFRRSSGKVKKIRNALIRITDRVSPMSMPPRPENFRIMHGQTHWALTAECAIEINRSITPALENFFRYCFSSDEKFFHSLVANSRFSNSSNGTGEIPYSGHGNWRYSNFHHIDSSLTKIYNVEDWQTIKASDKYFVRKVESSQSKELLDRLDHEML